MSSIFRKPQNYKEFKDLILRNCGFPVVELEIDEEQIDDAIFMAYKKYVDYHYDATERVYYSYRVTDLDIQNKFITLPENIIGVSNVWEISINSIANSIFGIRYQWALNDLFNMTASELSPFTNIMRHLSLVQELFATRPGLRFNRHSNKLQIDVDWNDSFKDRYIILEVYRPLDPAIYTDVWSDSWLTKYATALVKKQIGYHLMKFNMTLPGNVTYNGNEIYQMASDDILKLEEDLMTSSSLPPLDFIG